MTRQELFMYIKAQYGADPDYRDSRKEEYAVFRHDNTDNWFALYLRLPGTKLGRDSHEPVDLVTVKADPYLIDKVASQEGFYRAYDMNKLQWISIELEGNIEDDEICGFIQNSYNLTMKKAKHNINIREE